MLTRSIALAGALALVLGSFGGCSDSVSPTDSSAVDDPYAILKANDEAIQDVSEAPSYEEVMAEPVDARGNPVRHGADEKHWRDRGDSRDFRQAAARTYRGIVKALDLSAVQDSLFRLSLKGFRDCAKDDFQTYHDSRKARFEQLKTAVAELRAAVDAGTTTKEQAKESIKALVESYRTDIKALNETLKGALGGCSSELDTSVAGYFTAEQLASWNRLKG